MAQAINQSPIPARLTVHPSSRRYAIPQQYVIFAIFLLLFTQVSNLTNLVLGPLGSTNLVKQALSLPLIGFILWYRRHVLRGALAVPELSGLLALAVLSYFWSVSTDRWTAAIVSQVILGMTAIMLGSMMSMRGLMFAFAAMLLGSAFGSLAAVAVFPEARSSGDGTWAQTWRGLYGHKNGLGLYMGLALIMAITLYPLARVRTRAYLVVGGLLALFLLVHSQSLSSIALTMVIVAGLGMRYFFRERMALWAVVFLFTIFGLIALGALVLSTDIAQPIFDILGRKPTLSGRIPIWILSMDAVADRPWFGYGFFSFWDPESARVLAIERHPTMGYAPYYAHNGVVEVLLGLGIVGLLLAILMILRCFVAYFRVFAETGEGYLCVSYLCLVIAFVLSNIMEATILSRNTMMWVVFIAIATRLCLTSRLIRQEHRRARTVRAGGRATKYETV